MSNPIDPAAVLRATPIRIPPPSDRIHWHDCDGCGLKYGHETPDPIDREEFSRGTPDEIETYRETRRRARRESHTCPACDRYNGDELKGTPVASPPASIGAGWRVRFEVRHQRGPLAGELQYTCYGRLMPWAAWAELFNDDPFSRPSRLPTPEGQAPYGDSLPVCVYRYLFPSGESVDGCSDPMEIDSRRLRDIGGAPLPLHLVNIGEGGG